MGILVSCLLWVCNAGFISSTVVYQGNIQALQPELDCCKLSRLEACRYGAKGLQVIVVRSDKTQAISSMRA